MSMKAAARGAGQRLFVIVFFVALQLAAACAPEAVLAAGAENLRIEVLAQKYAQLGDAVLVESNGKYLLMDSFLPREKENLLGLLAKRTRTLDLYVSHYHGDHYGNIVNILRDRRFRVGRLYLPDPQYIRRYERKSREAARLVAAYRGMVRAAKDRRATVVYLRKGSVFRVGGAKVNILWGPCITGTNSTEHKSFHSYVNNASLVAKVSVKGFSYLTAGDLTASMEKVVIDSGVDLKADVLKLNHHGERGSNSKAFLKAVAPTRCFYQNGLEEEIHTRDSLKANIENAAEFADVYSSRYNGRVVFQYKNGRLKTTVQRHSAYRTRSKKEERPKRLGAAA